MSEEIEDTRQEEEVVDQDAAPGDDPFNLTTQLNSEGYVVGYIAVVKVIDDNMDVLTEFICRDIGRYEAVGMLTAILDRLRGSNALYGVEDEYEPEDEE